MDVPSRIGQYELGARLGRGGMGSVYLARHVTLGRLDALKLLQDLAAPEDRERFAREARAAASLNHVNIVTIYDHGEYEGVPYIAMEYVQGETLHALIQRRAEIALQDKLRLLESLCAGLVVAHRAGIIHRDLKPMNLMVNAEGVLKILDFGIARISGQTMTVPGAMTGTPGFMSPEQIEGVSIDLRADVFGAGAVAYALLAMNERGPFPGDSYHTIMHGVLHNEPLPLPVLGVSVGPELDAIVRRALAKDVGGRYQTAAQLGSAFEDARRTLEQGAPRVVSTEWSRPDTISRTVPSERARASVPSAVSRASVPAHRRRGVAAIAACGVAVVLGIGVWTLWPSTPRANPVDVPSARARGAGAVPETVESNLPSPPSVDRVPEPNVGSAPTISVDEPRPIIPAPVGTPPGRVNDTSPPPPSLASVPVRASSLFYGSGGPTADPQAVSPSHAGLLYRILQWADNGQERDVDPETTFQFGDRVRFAFEPNMDGYLYVLLEGSSGRWTVLFPSPQINEGRNSVEAFKEHFVPADNWFRFDNTPGTERVFVFLSKVPVVRLPGLDRPIAAGDTLARADGDSLVATVRSRDLVLETAAGSAQGPASQGPRGNFVVNRDELATAVTTTFELTHK